MWTLPCECNLLLPKVQSRVDGWFSIFMIIACSNQTESPFHKRPLVLWFSGSLVLWFSGSLVLWFSGSLVLLPSTIAQLCTLLLSLSFSLSLSLPPSVCLSVSLSLPHLPTRFVVKDLLQHQFFAEEMAMSVDVTQVDESSDKLLIRMKVHGEMKKKNGEEAIEFPYDLKTDKVEEVVGEMVSGLEEEEEVRAMGDVLGGERS